MKKVRFLLYSFIFLISLNYSGAFLISPSYYNVDFVPNDEKTLIISLINNNKEDIILDTYIKTVFLHPIAVEELKNSFSLNTSQIHFKEKDSVIVFALNIKFPEKLTLNGTNDLRVGAVESAGVGEVAFRAANEVRILIKNGEGEVITPPIEASVSGTAGQKGIEGVANSGNKKFLDIDVLGITATDVYLGEKSEITIKIKNNEKFKVYISGIINIFNDKEVAETINIPFTGIDPLKEINLLAYWDSKFASVGKYNVEAAITYDGGSKKVATTMNVKERTVRLIPPTNMILIPVGILFLILFIIFLILFLLSRKEEGIEIVSVNVINLIPNGVADIDIKYKNKDNKEYKNCYLIINIKNLNNVLVDSIKSNEENIKKKGEGCYSFGWDARNIPSGVYMVYVTLGYENKQTSKVVEVKL